MKEGIKMASVFKKLISKELGENNYNKYFYVCQKSIQNKFFDSKEIYNDIYGLLKNKDYNAIKKMELRLNDSLLLAVRISRMYYFSFLFFIGAVFILLSKGLNPFITAISIILMSICFVVKTYEYLVNKYCFIDAQIVLVYKTVLDKIMILNNERRQT